MKEEFTSSLFNTVLTGNTMKLFRQILPGKEIASLKFCASNQFYQDIKMTFKLTRKGHIYFANLSKILVLLLMKKEEKLYNPDTSE